MLMLLGILLMYLSMPFLMVPRAPITTGTVVVLSPNILSTSIFKTLYLLSFSVVLTEVLVLRGTVMSMRRQVLSFLFFSTISGLLGAMVLSVWMGMSHRMMILFFLGSWFHAHTIDLSPKYQIFCRFSSACVQLPCCGLLWWWWWWWLLLLLLLLLLLFNKQLYWSQIPIYKYTNT